jgi:hypothetical protein
VKRHGIAADAGQIAGARQGPVSRARRSLELQVGRKIAVGAQERNHALLVVGSQFLIECTAVNLTESEGESHSRG